MVGVAYSSFACLPIWGQHVANMSLFAWAEMLWPTVLLAVVGPANPAALGICLRQAYAIHPVLAAALAVAPFVMA